MKTSMNVTSNGQPHAVHVASAFAKRYTNPDDLYTWGPLIEALRLIKQPDDGYVEGALKMFKVITNFDADVAAFVAIREMRNAIGNKTHKNSTTSYNDFDGGATDMFRALTDKVTDGVPDVAAVIAAQGT